MADNLPVSLAERRSKGVLSPVVTTSGASGLGTCEHLHVELAGSQLASTSGTREFELQAAANRGAAENAGEVRSPLSCRSL